MVGMVEEYVSTAMKINASAFAEAWLGTRPKAKGPTGLLTRCEFHNLVVPVDEWCEVGISIFSTAMQPSVMTAAPSATPSAAARCRCNPSTSYARRPTASRPLPCPARAATKELEQVRFQACLYTLAPPLSPLNLTVPSGRPRIRLQKRRHTGTAGLTWHLSSTLQPRCPRILEVVCYFCVRQLVL